MAKVIVTGGAGFIGAHLALELQKEHDVVIVDNFSTGHFKNLRGYKGDIITADIQDVDWNQFSDADVIFHKASLCDTTVSDMRLMMENSVNPFRKVIEFTTKKNIPLIYASSAATYGDGPSPMKEDQTPNPLNAYGFSKMIKDNIAKAYMKKFPDAHIVGLRYFNVYGTKIKYKLTMAAMVYQLHQQMLKDQKPRVFKHGEQVRDFVYVKDVVQANLKAWKSAKKSCIVNVGSGEETSFNRIIELLNQQLGKNLKTKYIDNPYSFFQEHTLADMSYTKEMIGFTPSFSFEEGLKDYLQDYKKEEQ